MKAYKLTVYNTDMEGKAWYKASESYYTTREAAEAVADLFDERWTRGEVEEILIREEQTTESTKVLSLTTLDTHWPLRGGASRSVLSINRGLQKSVVDKQATDQAQKIPKNK